MSRTTIAYPGQPGAFSHQACLVFRPASEPVALPSFGAVVAAVKGGETDLGILPVENSAAGPVAEVHQLLADGGLATLSEHLLPVRMHLLALRGSRLADIRIVISHPMALAQCAGTLRSLALPGEAAANTAIAAKRLAASADRHVAVLASEAAAEAYGLTILRRDVHDQPDNATRFRVVGRPGEA